MAGAALRRGRPDGPPRAGPLCAALARAALASAALLCAALLAAPAARAQEGFRVADDPPGEGLSIRERPDAEAPAIGRAPSGARLRGFGCTNATPSGRTWCRVKYGRAVGWARRRYLAPE